MLNWYRYRLLLASNINKVIWFGLRKKKIKWIVVLIQSDNLSWNSPVVYLRVNKQQSFIPKMKTPNKRKTTKINDVKTYQWRKPHLKNEKIWQPFKTLNTSKSELWTKKWMTWVGWYDVCFIRLKNIIGF